MGLRTEGLLDMEKHHQMLQIMNKKVVLFKAKAAAKAETQGKCKEEKSSLRIIGAMRDILRNKMARRVLAVIDQLIGYIILEKYQGEGLSRNTLKDRSGKGEDITVHRKKEPPKSRPTKTVA